jgi:hypothetical protein
MNKWSPKTWAASLLAVGFGLRLLLSLTADGLSGIDAGAYLLDAYALMGHDVPAIDVTRPPLAPGWLLVPFLTLFGTVAGYNLFSAVASMALPLAAAFVGFRLFSPWKAVALTGYMAFDPASLGMMVTGALPLMGIALLLLASFALWETSAHGLRKGNAVLLVLTVGLLPFVNQTAAGLACLVLPLQWALLRNKRDTTVLLGLGALLALTALPWYVDVSPGNARLAYPGPLVIPHSVWEHQLYLGVAGLFLAWRAAHRPAFKMAAAHIRTATYLLAFLAFFQMFQSFNEVVMNLFFRATYLAVPFAAIVGVWMIPERLRLPSRAFVRAAAAAVVLVTVWQVRDQQSLSGYGTAALLDTAAAVPAGSEHIVTNTQATAFLVAGATGHPAKWTHYIEPPPGLAEQDEEARCVLGWIPGCTLPAEVGYVLVDTRMPLDAAGFAPDDLLSPYRAPERRPWHLLGGLPWLSLVAQNGPIELYEVNDATLATTPDA